jgi:hypothetical protein
MYLFFAFEGQKRTSGKVVNGDWVSIHQMRCILFGVDTCHSLARSLGISKICARMLMVYTMCVDMPSLGALAAMSRSVVRVSGLPIRTEHRMLLICHSVFV